jgi:hypothetical protein
MWYAVPFMAIGLTYFVGNMIRNERKHRLA